MGKISYINASPVFYGLDHGLLPDWLTMVADVPTVLNKKILEGSIKISPISAAFYAMYHEQLLLLPDLSISCHGPVMSVLLASNYEIEQLEGKKVIFSPESASSTSFLKMIFNQKKITPDYEVCPVNDPQTLSRADAVLVIGDTALLRDWTHQFKYCFDLGQLWYEMTALPFVFAVWVVRKSFAQRHPETVRKVHSLLMASKAQGEVHMNEIIKAGHEKLNIDISIVRKYFDLLLCDLDEKKVKAMKLFFNSLYEQGVIDRQAEIKIFK